MQNKKPRNEKDQRHGYWEVYCPMGTLWFKTNYINYEHFGVYMSYSYRGKLMRNEYYAR